MGVAERSPAGWLRDRLRMERLGRLLPRGADAPALRTAVVTDSAAGLLPEWTRAADARGGFAVVPLSIMAGDEIFADGPEAVAALGIALAAGRPVRTSRPAPGVFERVFRQLAEAGYESIVSVHLSGALSGTADAARLASERVDVPVHVVDTRTAGLAEGFAVQAAAAAAAAGLDGDGVVAAVHEALAGSEVRFFLPSLEQLRRGGRIGAAAAWVGTVLAIKPLLAIRDGQIVPIERIRTSARALPRLRELSVEDARRRVNPQLAVHYFGDRAEADGLAHELSRELGGDTDVIVSPLPAVLAAHTGPGVLAVVVAGPLREAR